MPGASLKDSTYDLIYAFRVMRAERLSNPTGGPTPRPLYNRAATALGEAHRACFSHPDRGPLGMSYGPFSGVNEALGIIARLEDENRLLRRVAFHRNSFLATDA